MLKLNISNKGKSWKLEAPNEVLEGKSVGDKIDGKIIKQELQGYGLEITGGSDFAGFPMKKDVEGIGLKRVLLTKGWGMHSKPKGLKKRRPRMSKGLRLRKTVRGKTISEKTIQLNLNVTKEGPTSLEKIFPGQNNPKEKPEQETDTQTPKEKQTPPEKEQHKETTAPTV